MLQEKLKSMSKDEKRMLLTAATYADFANFGKTYIRLELSAAFESGDYSMALAVIRINRYEIAGALTWEHERMEKAAKLDYTLEERAHSAYLAEITGRLYNFMMNYII